MKSVALKITLTVFRHLEDFQTIKCRGYNFELKALKIYIGKLLPQPKENKLFIVYTEYIVIKPVKYKWHNPISDKIILKL